jgi:hypothetical protein
VCGYAGTCTTRAVAWTFTIAPDGQSGEGDTTIPEGFPAGPQRHVDTAKR